jgi:Xaa-Pro aminopeptidase
MFEIHREKVINELKKSRIDGLLVTDNSNKFYLTGLELDGYWIIVTRNGINILTTKMLFGQIKMLMNDIEIFYDCDNISGLVKCLKQNKIRTLGFDSNQITVNLFNKLKKKLSDISLIELPDFIKKIRQIKTEYELNKIKHSCNIAVKTFKKIKEYIKPGMTEKQISNKIIDILNEYNVNYSFPPIVASGSNSAYPHHLSSNKKIRTNDFVLIDLGCKYEGYCSDYTRTIFLGYSTDTTFKQIYKIYDIVKRAQLTVINNIKPGMIVSEIDLSVRKIFKKYGYEKYFIHNTGHGIGIDIHELPVVSRKSDTILRSGIVITIEPGIYIPKIGGIRIEDTILITEKGCEIITND